jgi:hypothetical protein
MKLNVYTKTIISVLLIFLLIYLLTSLILINKLNPGRNTNNYNSEQKEIKIEEKKKVSFEDFEEERGKIYGVIVDQNKFEELKYNKFLPDEIKNRNMKKMPYFLIDKYKDIKLVNSFLVEKENKKRYIDEKNLKNIIISKKTREILCKRENIEFYELGKVCEVKLIDNYKNDNFQKFGRLLII